MIPKVEGMACGGGSISTAWPSAELEGKHNSS